MLVGLFAGILMGAGTILLGVPMAFLLTVRQSRGAFMAVLLWWVGAYMGLVGGFDGPFRLPWLVGLPVALAFGIMFLSNFVRLFAVALSRAWGSWMLFRSGMPPSEII